MKGFLYLLGLWLFFGCSRDADPQALFQGTYVGTFERNNGKPSQVELTFTGNRYTGKVIPYPSGAINDAATPVICQGTFTVSGKTINFQDECVYTANFDWSLILSREWAFSTGNKGLILARNMDQYALMK